MIETITKIWVTFYVKRASFGFHPLIIPGWRLVEFYI